MVESPSPPDSSRRVHLEPVPRPRGSGALGTDPETRDRSLPPLGGKAGIRTTVPWVTDKQVQVPNTLHPITGRDDYDRDTPEVGLGD